MWFFRGKMLKQCGFVLSVGASGAKKSVLPQLNGARKAKNFNLQSNAVFESNKPPPSLPTFSTTLYHNSTQIAILCRKIIKYWQYNKMNGQCYLRKKNEQRTSSVVPKGKCAINKPCCHQKEKAQSELLPKGCPQKEKAKSQKMEDVER